MGLFKKSKAGKKAAPAKTQPKAPAPVQNSSQPRTLVKKISLLGDPAVGKTSLIHRFVYEAFDDKYLSTIGAKVTKKSHLFAAEEYEGLSQDTNFTFLIWDIAGQKAFKSVHQAYYVGSEGALVVCDLTRKETLDNLLDWISELFKVVRNVPVLILANKCDLEDRICFGEAELRAVASQINAPFYFSSAKTGHNVEIAFERLGEHILGIEPVAGKADEGAGGPQPPS